MVRGTIVWRNIGIFTKKMDYENNEVLTNLI